MDRQNDAQLASGRGEDRLCGRDSREDTRVPNSPELAALKDTCTTPSMESPHESVILDDLEKAQSVNISPRRPKSWLRRHFQEEVTRDWTDVLLLLCWFTTGFLDSTIFNGMRESKAVPERRG